MYEEYKEYKMYEEDEEYKEHKYYWNMFFSFLMMNYTVY